MSAFGDTLYAWFLTGAGYQWWSGAGSDLGELAIIGGVYAGLRKINCEVHGCWRIGRHGTAAGHRSCRKHHPDERLTVEALHAAHYAALAQQDIPRPR